MRGDLLLDELTQHYDLDFEIEEAEEAETVGGLIMSVLGQVAQPGDEVMVENVRMVVESVDGLAVSTALLHLPEAPTDSDTESDEAPANKG